MQDMLHDNVKINRVAREKLMNHFLVKLHFIQREVEWMNRKVKPLRRVIQQLIEDPNMAKELIYYLNDSVNSISDIQAEIISILSLLTAMKLEFENLNDRRMNHLLGILTLTTVCVLRKQQ
jgi:Mg2+ and Co2+ transporter CorA